MRSILVLFLLSLTVAINGSEYKIREKNYYGGESYELQAVTSGGASFQRILELTEPNDDEIFIRILSPLDVNTKAEIIKSLEESQRSAEVSSDVFLGQEGTSLSRRFESALMQSTWFKGISATLSEYNYSITKVHFEKLNYKGSDISVAEISFSCVKKISSS